MKLSILCRTAAAALFCALPMLAQVPVGYVQVTGSTLTDSSGVPVANATIAFAPVNNSGTAIGYQVNGKGQAITSPVTTLVTAGAFSIRLADTTLTAPVNVCFSVTVTDNTSGKSYLGPGYICFQPAGYGPAVANGMCTAASGTAGGTCNFDKFQPNLVGLVVQQTGPAGPVGPIGPTGPPGGSMSYPGVTSDGSNGLNVTGSVAAGTATPTKFGSLGVIFPDNSTQATSTAAALTGGANDATARATANTALLQTAPSLGNLAAPAFLVDGLNNLTISCSSGSPFWCAGNTPCAVVSPYTAPIATPATTKYNATCNGLGYKSSNISSIAVSVSVGLTPTPMIFSALSSYVGPTTGTATLAFARSFEASELQSDGSWLDAAHLAAAYTWNSTLSRNVFKSTFNQTGCTNCEYSSKVVNNRDLTQVGWVKTNMTATKDQTGIKNDANAASSLLATTANGTATFALTQTGNAYLSAFIKRLTGTGTVSLTTDGGTTWTDVTSQINGSTYTRVSIAHANSNPAIGFKLGTNADKIAVDAVNDTTIGTTGVSKLMDPLITRYIDVNGATTVLTFSSLNPAPVAPNRYYLSVYLTPVLDGGYQLRMGSTGASFIRLLSSTGNAFNLSTNNGTTAQYNSTVTWVPPTGTGCTVNFIDCEHKLGLIFGNGQAQFLVDDVLQNTLDSFANTDPTGLSTITLTGAGNFRDMSLQELHSYEVNLVGDSLTAHAEYAPAWRGLSPVSYQFQNRGVSGNTILDVQARYATDVTPYYNSHAAGNEVVLWIGTNSLAANVSASAALAQLTTLISSIKSGAAWNHVYCVNLLNRGGGFSNGATAASFAAAQATYNAGLTGAGCSAVADVQSIPQMADPSNGTYFDSFQIHPTTLGYTYIMPTIMALMNSN